MTNDKPMIERPSYIDGVRKAEEKRRARAERARAALDGMIDLIVTRDIDAAAKAREKAIKRLAKYPPSAPSPHITLHPSPRGQRGMMLARRPQMFDGIVEGSWAGSRRIRREWERFLDKHGYETMKAFLDIVERGAFPR